MLELALTQVLRFLRFINLYIYFNIYIYITQKPQSAESMAVVHDAVRRINHFVSQPRCPNPRRGFCMVSLISTGFRSTAVSLPFYCGNQYPGMAILIGFKDFIQFYFVLFALIFITLRFGIPACAVRVGCYACGRVTIVC